MIFSGFGPGEAAGRRRADFRVVVWYRKSDPLGTFQYQVYDVRKGEDSPAVDRWIKNLERNFPAYVVVSRAVDATREHGGTDQLKVGAVVKRELTVAAARAGVVLGEAPSPIVARPPPSRPASASPRPSRPLGAAGTSDPGPPAPSFPVPFPYPRPHP